LEGKYYLRSLGYRYSPGGTQFIIEEREKHANSDLFWAKFSDQLGTRFSFTQILTTLKHERTGRDAQDTADALQFFGGDLGHVDANSAFSYSSRTGGKVIMTKMGDIAKNWRTVLSRDPLIAARWSAQQADR
jgi:hypothetical protein